MAIGVAGTLGGDVGEPGDALVCVCVSSQSKSA